MVEVAVKKHKLSTKSEIQQPADRAKTPTAHKTMAPTSNVMLQNMNSPHSMQYTDHVGIKNWQYQLTCDKL